MSYQQFEPNKMKPNELRIHWGMMKSELEHKEATLILQGHELERAYKQLKQVEDELDKREEELKRRTSELTTMKTALEVMKVELGQKKVVSFRSKLLAVIISVFFGISTILFNLANSLITSNPPNSNGNTLLAVAGIIYFGCAITTIFALGGSN